MGKENNEIQRIKRKPRHRLNGEGSIYFDKSKNLWVYEKSKSKITSRDKNKLLEKIEKRKIISSSGIGSLDNVYFEDYILSWLYNVKKNNLKPTSFNRAELTIKTHIIPKIGFYKIKELTSEIIQNELINKMKDDGLSLSSINKAYVYSHACLQYAVDNHKLLYNLCDTVTLPNANMWPSTDENIKFLNDDEIEKFKKAAVSYITYTNKYGLTVKTRKPHFFYGYLFIFDIYTGLRIGELMALQWKDIDLIKKQVTINKSVIMDLDRANGNKITPVMQQSVKSQQSVRIIPLGASAIDAITKYKKIHYFGENSLLMSIDGKKMILTSNAIRSCNKIFEAAGLTDKRGVHTLRHTFASLLIRRNVNIDVVSKLLGHKNVAFTYKIYVHLIEEQKVSAIRELDNI